MGRKTVNRQRTKTRSSYYSREFTIRVLVRSGDLVKRNPVPLIIVPWFKPACFISTSAMSDKSGYAEISTVPALIGEWGIAHNASCEYGRRGYAIFTLFPIFLRPRERSAVLNVMQTRAWRSSVNPFLSHIALHILVLRLRLRPGMSARNVLIWSKWGNQNA